MAMRKIRVRLLAKAVDRLLSKALERDSGDPSVDLEEAVAKWSSVKCDLKNATNDDCAYISQRLLNYESEIRPGRDNVLVAHAYLDLIRHALRLREGGNKCPPWEEPCL